MASWHSFEPAQFFPTPVQRAVTALDTAVTATTTAANIVAKGLRIAQRLSRQAATNPVEAALRVTLQQIDTFVAGLLGETQCHAILIPIRKRALRRSADSTSLLDDWLRPEESAYEFVQAARTATAGPGVFFRTLVESVADAGDVNRPDFPADYATVGACIIAGAETLNDLQVPMRLLATLFTSNMRLPVASNTAPVVQNLRITTAALRGGTGVVLRWDPLPPVKNFPLFGGDVVVAKEIFVIRTTEPLRGGWTAWDDLFPGIEPSDNLSNLPQSGNARVIARIRNNGLVTGYTDATNLLDPEQTYYFTTCVRYSINNEIQPMGSLSSVVRATRRQPTPATSQGVPPDWIATPSLARMIPPLEQVINRVRIGLSRLETRTVSTGSQQLIGQTVAQLERLIAQWQQTINELSDVTNRLQAITTAGSPSGMYSTVISTSSGGMGAWLAELAKRMSDTTDTSRPDLSDQATVIGFVIVAGAPRPPELAALRRLIDLFFGSHPRNPLFTILQDLDGNPAAPIATTPAPVPVLGYDAALNPSTVPTC